MTDRPLAVIKGGELGRTSAAARTPSLDAQPFRPGELPELLVLELSDDVVAYAEGAAAKAGVPIELWVRVAVEVGRHFRAIVEATLDTSEVFAEVLAAAAAGATHDHIAAVDARRQRAYALSVLRARARPVHRKRSRRLSLLVADQMIAAWGLDAARTGVTLPTYVSEAVGASRSIDVLAVEAASAERAMTVGEWMYMIALREVTRR